MSRSKIVRILAALTLLSTVAYGSEKKLHNFNYTNGSNPWYDGLASDANGNLYGTVTGGGAYGGGVVFELTSDMEGNWTEKILHNFGNGTDGWMPTGGLIFDAEGNLYGTTENGGSAGGTVFELSPNGHGGWTEKKLHNFGNGNDGVFPYSGLISDAAGNLYGTTAQGGSFGGGTVYELSPNGNGSWTEKKLHNFGNGTDGSFPQYGLVFDAAGNLYGTTPYGGSHRCGIGGCGIVFELLPNGNGGWTEKKLYNFGSSSDGTLPYGGLVLNQEGNLYGTTSSGGDYGGGTVFEMMSSDDGHWTEKKLHNFGNRNDGASPWATMTFDSAGNLYGTTSNGGDYGEGTVFELSPNGNGGWTERRLHNFGSGNDGQNPEGTLIFDPAGNMYGTTRLGGSYRCGVLFGCGTIFQIEP